MIQGKRPIGIFDSGIGGLSVLLEAKKRLPCEDFIFYGDNQNAPYGNRTEAEIKRLTLQCGAFLYQKGVKMIVMACNTATSAAVLMMREKYRIPVVSMEPAIKPAVAALKDGKVLVLATPATITQRRYRGLMARVGSQDRIINIGCGGLVELLENGDFVSPEIDRYIDGHIGHLKGSVIDGIVIGCTHYSFIADRIAAYAKAHFKGERKMYDGKKGTAKQIWRILEENDLENTQRKEGSVAFYSSGGEDYVALFKRITGM